MIIAHLSDLHLGHQSYESSGGEGGLRERDVARAFQAAVAEIVRMQPDAVVVAGDVFDGPEPSAGALVTLARSLESLRSSLPDTPVLMVAGARDTPRAWGDPGALAALDTFGNVDAATGTPRSVHVGGEAHFFLLPHRSVLFEPFPEVRPDPDARWNVLVAYGRAEASTGGEAAPFRAVGADPDDWDYIALGHEHAFRRVRPNAAYSGSLERVGPEPWKEAHVRKGFAVADLDQGRIDFREVPARPVVALAPISWDPDRPDRMNQRIREVKEEVPGGMEEKIVRLRLEGMTPDALRRLDGDLLAEIRDEAIWLAVEVEEEPPEESAPGASTGADALKRVIRAIDEVEDDPGHRTELVAAAESLFEEDGG